MTKSIARTALFAAFALALASFTGSAIAGNGNGTTPPGQEKQAEQAAPAAAPAAPAAAPAAQPAAPGNPAAPGQQKKAASASATASSSTSSPGQAKQAAKASTSTPGVKPSNTTTGVKPTHCSTGGTSTAATCSGNGPKADGSKQYGNGKTAAQIAVSRGAPAGTVLTGPGNSQPHKVAVCPKKTNKSGGVDVHAVKSYSAADCTQSSTQSSTLETKSDCTGTTVTSTSTATVAANKQGKVKAHGNAGQNGKHKGLVSKQESVVTSTFTPSNNPNCATTNAGAPAGTAAVNATAAGTPNGPVTAEVPIIGQTGTPAIAAGGVLGEQTPLVQSAAKPAAGGILGATARLGGTLPFTGLPLWIVVLAALALIGGGLTLRTARQH